MDKEIIMGCCEPVLGPIQNYYTKFVIDKKLEEISSAITAVESEISSLQNQINTLRTAISGCCGDYLDENI